MGLPFSMTLLYLLKLKQKTPLFWEDLLQCGEKLPKSLLDFLIVILRGFEDYGDRRSKPPPTRCFMVSSMIFFL